MKYIVKINYTKFRFKEIEEAAGFAQAAKDTAEEDVEVSLIFAKEEEED